METISLEEAARRWAVLILGFKHILDALQRIQDEKDNNEDN